MLHPIQARWKATRVNSSGRMCVESPSAVICAREKMYPQGRVCTWRATGESQFKIISAMQYQRRRLEKGLALVEFQSVLQASLAVKLVALRTWRQFRVCSSTDKLSTMIARTLELGASKPTESSGHLDSANSSQASPHPHLLGVEFDWDFVASIA